MLIRQPRRSRLALFAATCAFLAACGGSDAEDLGSSPAPTTAAESTTAADADDFDAIDDSATDTPEDADAGTPGDTNGAAGTGANPAIASGALTSDYLDSYSLVDDELGTMTTVTVDGTTRTIVTNALPDHETGDFPNSGNPNAIAAQDLTWEFSSVGTFTGRATDVRTTGVAINGVKFEPGTAETLTCSEGDTYRIEAIQDLLDLGLDFNNAHVQPGGEYHYHGISDLLVDAHSHGEDLVHVGFAADGNLIYYSISGAYPSGYELSDQIRSGTDCVISGPGGANIDVDGTAPDGTYTSDWAFAGGDGQLDECNGTTIDGQYVYFMTDEFPYAPRCLMGEVAQGAAGGPGGAAGSGPDDAAGPGNGPDGEESAQGPGGQHPPEIVAAAEALGVDAGELAQALGPPPGDFERAAEQLGVSIDALRAALPGPGS